MSANVLKYSNHLHIGIYEKARPLPGIPELKQVCNNRIYFPMLSTGLFHY